MTVFVVLWYNYGDQGVDFLGVFGSKQKAQDFINEREPDENERTYYAIKEEIVQ